LIRSVGDFKSPLKDVFSLISQMGYFKSMNKSDALHGFHASNGHSIEECSEFKDFFAGFDESTPIAD